MTHITSKEVAEGNLKSIMRIILALAAHYKPQSVKAPASSSSSSPPNHNNSNNNNHHHHQKQESHAPARTPPSTGVTTQPITHGKLTPEELVQNYDWQVCDIVI